MNTAFSRKPLMMYIQPTSILIDLKTSKQQLNIWEYGTRHKKTDFLQARNKGAYITTCGY